MMDYEKENIRLETENLQLKERVAFLEKLALSDKNGKQDRWFTGPITTYPVPPKLPHTVCLQTGSLNGGTYGSN